jgi:hypothetical protein
MTEKKRLNKGLKTEELVRTYFLRAGFFVLRGVKLRSGGEDLTDIDLWVYERSATLARRRTIIDIKDKRTPQAAERLFFIKGLADAIQVDGVGLVTTDSRSLLRILAREHGAILIDGVDLQRIKNSSEMNGGDRLSEEDFTAAMFQVDRARSTRSFRDRYEVIKSSVADRFGPASGNTALDGVSAFAREAVAAHPGSISAQVAGRLAYLATAIAAASFDYASAESALRPASERVQHLIEAIRYGDDPEGTERRLRWAEAAIREYAPNGPGIAQIVRERFAAELNRVPAEGLAEILDRLSRNDALFSIAKGLERAAYATSLPSFDELAIPEKSLFGAVLDFAQIERARFAKAWSKSTSEDLFSKVAAEETTSSIGGDNADTDSQNEPS